MRLSSYSGKVTHILSAIYAGLWSWLPEKEILVIYWLICYKMYGQTCLKTIGFKSKLLYKYWIYISFLPLQLDWEQSFLSPRLLGLAVDLHHHQIDLNNPTVAFLRLHPTSLAWKTKLFLWTILLQKRWKAKSFVGL